MEEKNGTKKCIFCAEDIKQEAKICRFCGMNLETGKHVSDQSQQAAPAAPGIPVVKAKSGVMSGVKIGFGMFIVLPLLVLIAIAVLFRACS